MTRTIARSFVVSMLACLASSTLVACGGAGGDAGVGPKPPASDSGHVNFTITRSINRPIPAQADSAWVRLYNTGTGYSQAQQVVIPPPGGAAQLIFDVPAGTGYSVAVLAWKRYNTFVEVLAGGKTDNLVVALGQSTSAIVSAVPWSFTFGGTDTLRSTVPATISLQVTGGPTFLMGASPSYFWLGSSQLDMGNSITATAPTLSFTPPQTAVDTAMYFRARFDAVGGAYAPPGQQSRIVYVQFTSQSLNAPLYRVPQKAVTGGTVTVTF